MIGFLVAGLIIGALARLIKPGKQNLGLLATLGLGLVGSLIGGLIAQLFGTGSIWELNILGFVLFRRVCHRARVLTGAGGPLGRGVAGSAVRRQDGPASPRDHACPSRPSDPRSWRPGRWAVTTAGLEMAWTEETELPFEVRGALLLPDQAQVHPLLALDALLTDLVENGGTLIEDAR